MGKLGVNTDPIATVRQARKTDEPDPVWAAVEAELGGADGITFHLREDRRHINDRDARVLKETVAAKLNMEMSIASGIVRIAGELKPDQCTLVPEKREELTTEGGLNVKKFARRIRRVVSDLHKKGITLNAFIEPDLDQIRASADCGFDAIELWTGGYAHAKTPRAIQREIKRLDRGVETGIECGLEVHGGHGLTYRNIERIAAIPGFGEFHIGHAIVARATLVGMRTAVEQMKDLLYQYSPVELM